MVKCRIYDVSLNVYPGMLCYPGDPVVQVDALTSTMKGDVSTISHLHLGSHTGTHVDAPCHFIPGAAGVDRIPPEVLVGEARLFQLPEADCIDRPLLERLDFGGMNRLLFGTRNSALLKRAVFCPDYVYVTEDAAVYLVEEGIKLVGIDYLSVDDFKRDDCPAHHVLLGAGVVIEEGLNLSGVPAGDYEIFCLPVKIEGCDGAPARVFLREMK